MSKGNQKDSRLVTLSRPDSHLVPLRANQGKYVTTNAGKFIVSLKGLFRIHKECFEFGGKLKESKLIFSRFVYVGTLYPDGSSLPFIPVANAELRKGETNREYGYNRTGTTESSDSAFYVQLIIPCSVWSELFCKLDTHTGSFNNVEITYGNVTIYPKHEECAIFCRVEADREVTVCLDGAWFSRPIKEVLKGDIGLQGNVFLMPKYTSTPASGVAKLSFEIYGMWVTHKLDELFGPFQWRKVIY